MPSLRASATAMCSLLVSTIQTALGTLRHVADAAEGACSSLSFSRRRTSSSFFVRPEPATSSKSISSSSLRRCEALVHGLEVGEHAAEPALVDVGHADAGGLLGDGLLGLLLGADEQDRAAVGDGLLDELVGAVDVGQRLLQVDDVDAVALGEDEALHLRVPAAGLVPEVDAALEQLAHGDDGHGFLPLSCANSRAVGCHAPSGDGGVLMSRSDRAAGADRSGHSTCWDMRIRARGPVSAFYAGTAGVWKSPRRGRGIHRSRWS